MAILAAGQALPFEVIAAKIDLPELQGEPEEISVEKCRIAAQQVRPEAQLKPQCRQPLDNRCPSGSPVALGQLLNQAAPGIAA